MVDGGHDFRPELGRRVPDPSLTEMLRRARDAPLGNEPHRASVAAPRLRPVTGGWRRGLALLLIGALLGALGTIGLFHGGVAVTIYQPPLVSSQPPSPSPKPTPTSLPTPTTQEIVTAVQACYDNTAPFAGHYLLIGITGIAVVRPDATHLTACIAYVAASRSSPATVAGGNTRLFTLAATSDGSWRVVEMGESDSCTLS